MKSLVVGRLGSGEPVDFSGVTDPSAKYNLGGWLLDIPNVSPAWRHFYLSVIHLRDEPGDDPAVLEFPGATHELVLWALDHTQGEPDRHRPQEFRRMQPINVHLQFAADTDEQAVSVLQHVAQALVDGSLPVEPVGIRDADKVWAERVAWFAGHVKETGCTEAKAATAAGQGNGHVN